MAITKRVFGKTKGQEEVTAFTMTNKNGMQVEVMDYGAIVLRIVVPDGNGVMGDVNLGYGDLASYEEKNGPGFGSFIGRHANRIGGAAFTLNGKRYELEKNDGENNLHGGSPGYNRLMYKAECREGDGYDEVTFSRTSPDGEQGFPGTLEASVTYRLNDENEWWLTYDATSDQDTPINFTNHAYFNLAGHDAGDVLGHKVIMMADQFTPTGGDLIPTGEVVDVTGTPMDFRKAKEIGKEIDEDYEPLALGGGYDHNFVLKKDGAGVQYAGSLIHEGSGRKMDIYTDLPGMQLYTGNFIMDEDGKDGAKYKKRDGVCFETQYFPNSCNIPTFESCVRKAGERYHTVTQYKFGVV